MYVQINTLDAVIFAVNKKSGLISEAAFSDVNVY